MLNKYTLIATTSAAVDITTGAVNLGNASCYSVMAIISGSDVAGTFNVQGSNDGTNFVNVATGTAVTASADVLLNYDGAGYQYVRVFWDYTSGTGNITVTLVAKNPGVTVAQG